jgi:subtilisin family serine protease
MKRWIAGLTILVITNSSYLFPTLQGADRYWIYFKDKGQYENLNLSKQRQIQTQYLTQDALQRRQLRGTAISAYADLPLESDYIEQIKARGTEIHAFSRWMNAVSGSGTAMQLSQIAALPFVKAVKKVKTWQFGEKHTSFSSGQHHSGHYLSRQEYGFSDFQIRFHNIHRLHERGLTGSGINVAVFDTGFNLENPALQHIRSQLIAEYDFIQMDSVTSNQPGDPSNQDNHGTFVLSVLASYFPDTLMGPAYGANFLLAKTEVEDQELRVEEDNWVMAAEWAERLGADIVSSSVGYSEFDPGQGGYSYKDLDGKTTIITRAANELARRGVLVVNSAGNEGNLPWHYITAPADGFYVLAVGSVNSNNVLSASSSRGPTYDGRIKPDLVALGVGVYGITSRGTIRSNNGTSYSCPLVAGIAAQILEQFPRADLLTMLNILRTSGDQSQLPDNEKGYGKIDALRAWELAEETSAATNRYAVLNPLPNPYFIDNGIIFFPVDLNSPQRIQLQIFTILGQKVIEVYQDGLEGRNLLSWNARNFNGIPRAAGIYIYRIKAGPLISTGKLTLLF